MLLHEAANQEYINQTRKIHLKSASRAPAIYPEVNWSNYLIAIPVQSIGITTTDQKRVGQPVLVCPL
jgi:hypothetical protein